MEGNAKSSGCRLAVGLLVTAALGWSSPGLAAPAVKIDGDDIGGVVRGPKGPEAGVWVIAETTDLPTKFARIVITDEQGRYVVPDLPKAGYRVWVRGYGLVDSPAVRTKPGRQLDLKAVAAPDARAAAQYYPANYWYALAKVPAPEAFPGTGPKGNKIGTTMKTQAHWMYATKENCLYCHQLGTKATREFSQGFDTYKSSIEAWDHRVQKGGSRGALMSSYMSRFGREEGLKMYADWTDRIAAGEVPPEAPPRPSGIERNIVLTLWDWAGQDVVHDEIASDKRNPAVNANGRVYGVDMGPTGKLVWVDPGRNTDGEIVVPTRAAQGGSSPHNPMMDQKGRVWMTSVVRDEDKNPSFCTDGAANRFAKFFPVEKSVGSIRQLSYYDPASGEIKLIDTCFGTHHLEFAHDADNTLFLSGDQNVMGWINTRIYDQTGDEKAAVGWCPIVLDTNGDGRMGEWTEPGQPDDPKKDKRLNGFLYGLGVNPVDQSAWFAYYTYGISPGVPGGIVRLERGAHPPETCKVEFYEPPVRDGLASAFNPRGVDIDTNGLAWVAFGSGQVASFDRRKCKTLNGPTATGQHCPEGWTLHRTPGPNFKGAVVGGSSDWHYLTWVDQFDVLGLGKNTPIVPGSLSDSLVAMAPESGKFTVMRVPYPLGFYARGLDGRIDDPKAGWKGRGLWATYANFVVSHIEGGAGTRGKIVKFQMRPDPLAH